MKSQKQNMEKQEKVVDEYVENKGSPTDESRPKKFVLTENLSEEISWLSDAEGVNQTEIVKRALHNYFSRSHYLNNRRYFLEKASGSKVDLSKATTNTEVNVRWCNGKLDSVEKSIFVACRILDIDDDNVLINPIYYPLVSMVDHAALIKKSELVVPGFIDFNPQDLYSSLPYLHQLTYKIKSKYLWPITPISNDL